jgi:putative oxidoreductase
MKSQRQLDERKEPLRDVAFQLLSRFPIARWAPIPLRLIVGYGFMEHGFAKLARGSDAFAPSWTR